MKFWSWISTFFSFGINKGLNTLPCSTPTATEWQNATVWMILYQSKFLKDMLSNITRFLWRSHKKLYSQSEEWHNLRQNAGTPNLSQTLKMADFLGSKFHMFLLQKWQFLFKITKVWVFLSKQAILCEKIMKIEDFSLLVKFLSFKQTPCTFS